MCSLCAMNAERLRGRGRADAHVLPMKLVLLL